MYCLPLVFANGKHGDKPALTKPLERLAHLARAPLQKRRDLLVTERAVLLK